MLGLVHALLALAATVGLLQDWYVDANAADCAAATGSPAAPFCTISEAIVAAVDGDTIHIAPGTYVENLALDEDLALVGTQGDALTIVDGNQADSVVAVLPGASVAINGLTLQNGRAEIGAGIRVDSDPTEPTTHLTLTDSTVCDNTAYSETHAIGGGISATGNTDVALLRSTIERNMALGSQDGIALSNATGGGISNRGQMMTLTECKVASNRVFAYFDFRGDAILNQGRLEIRSSLIADHANPGHRLMQTSGELTMTNTTVAGNKHSSGFTGGAALTVEIPVPVTIDGCIFWDNGVIFTVGPLQISDPGNTATVTNSVLQGGWTGAGANNLDTDPLFSDPAAGDYSLAPASPCIDTGGAGTVLSSKGLGGNPRRLDGDLDRTMIVDMGAYEFGNVHVEVSGNATPGGMLTFDFTGTPGLTARLVIGSAPGELVYSPGGTLFFDLGSPFFKFNAGTLPSTLNLSIPATVPVGTYSVIQAFAIGSPLPNGKLPLNFSNAIEVVIR